MSNKIKSRDTSFSVWLDEVQSIAVVQKLAVDRKQAFWRECFDDGLTPYQAFQESFVEDDGI